MLIYRSRWCRARMKKTCPPPVIFQPQGPVMLIALSCPADTQGRMLPPLYRTTQGCPPVILLAAADALNSFLSCRRNRENNIDLFAAKTAIKPSCFCFSPGRHVRLGLYLSCHLTASFQTLRLNHANISIRAGKHGFGARHFPCRAYPYTRSYHGKITL